MESQSSITRQYNKLLNDVAKKDFYKIDLTNRLNCYTCNDPKCGHITKTKDVDAGVTPMFFKCEICGTKAISSMYRDIVPIQKHTIEWYRPSLNQVLKMRKKPDLLYHIFRGGLDSRKV